MKKTIILHVFGGAMLCGCLHRRRIFCVNPIWIFQLETLIKGQWSISLLKGREIWFSKFPSKAVNCKRFYESSYARQSWWVKCCMIQWVRVWTSSDNWKWYAPWQTNWTGVACNERSVGCGEFEAPMTSWYSINYEWCGAHCNARSDLL